MADTKNRNKPVFKNKHKFVCCMCDTIRTHSSRHFACTAHDRGTFT